MLRHGEAAQEEAVWFTVKEGVVEDSLLLLLLLLIALLIPWHLAAVFVLWSFGCSSVICLCFRELAGK